MLKYYIAIGVLSIVALTLIGLGICQDYSCKDYFGNFKMGGSTDPLEKYQADLKDPRFAKADVMEIGGRVKETGHCERYRRAIQSITLGVDRETSEQKVEAILLYKEADERMCTNDN